MKLRAAIVAMMMGGFAIAAANCGSDGDTQTDAGVKDGGSSGNVFGGEGAAGETSVAGKTCTKLTCDDLKINCGPAGDGCGGVIQCGATCATGTCGGGGQPSICGGPSPCQPTTCAALGVECGPAGDGCGGAITCGSCSDPAICGGAGPSKCGGGRVLADGGLLLADGGACQPRTTCNTGECGPVADGCGGLLQCNTCAAGFTCGAVTPSMCGVPACTKVTCAQANANCGFAADGCGGILDCGGPDACDALGSACGLGGPNKCGGTGQTGGNCVNYCVDQLQNGTCAAGQKTKITGTVYAPNGKLPLPAVQVYIPNGSKTSPYGVQPFTDGTGTATCDQCSLSALGSPLVAATTAADGTFTLDDVPPGVAFPLVIQLGRWRRLVTIPALTKCTTTALTPDQTRFPKKQTETSTLDNIPLIAISTGSLDALECLFLKLGVDPTMFSNPAGAATNAGTGRIRLYRDNDNGSALGGATIDSNTPRTDAALTDTADHLNQYDAVLFGCAGAPNNRPSDVDTRVRAYADRGGRLFATHYNYTYLYDNPPWDKTVTWDTQNERQFDTANGLLNTSFPKGLLLSQWLAVPVNGATGQGVGALTNMSPPEVTLTQARNNADLPMGTGAQSWMTRAEDGQGAGTAVFHYTFNTPVGAAAAQQCGRVLFSDFHVSTGSTAGTTFPNECSASGLSAQEKILSYFLFDLTSCIQPDIPPPPPVCNKTSCSDQQIACGKAGDGCGGEQDCPACPATQVCQGNPPACITPTCTPTTCSAAGAECGKIANGCGAPLDCGPCPAGATCGGNGPNKCGSNTCTPTTCDAQQIHCGPAGNGCGDTLDCGPCPAGQTCGGGGVPNTCGAPSCTKRTCADANAECGPIADGCGGLVDCGVCPAGTRCGYGGVPNRCAILPPN